MSSEKRITYDVIGRPPELRNAEMVYDSGRNVIILFGGETVGAGAATINETWELDLDAGTWTQKFPENSPPARTKFGMVYDSARAKVVLFGGFKAITFDVLNDTWEYDGTDWTQNTAEVPTELDGRAQGGMVYDAARAKTVWFGGIDLASNDVNDTFEYNGTSWSLVTPTVSPPDGRQDNQMAFDPVRKKVVLFGGFAFPGFALQDETWEYDGTTWILVSTSLTPPVRVRGAMAWHGGLKALILVQGEKSGIGAGTSEVWTYDGSWAQLFPSDTGPTDRDLVATAGDTKRGTVVMFGGETTPTSGTAFDETWEFAADEEWDLLPLGFELSDPDKLEVLNGGRFQASFFPGSGKLENILSVPFFATAIESFDATFEVSPPLGNDVEFAFEIDGQLKWFSTITSVWEDSIGAPSEVNTAAELTDAVMIQMPLAAAGSLVRVFVCLQTGGTSSPEIEEVRLQIETVARAEPVLPNLCRVFGWFRDEEGVPIELATVRVRLPAGGFEHTGHTVGEESVKVLTGADGFWEIDLFETETITKKVSFDFVHWRGGRPLIATFADIEIPDQATAAFTSLTTP